MFGYHWHSVLAARECECGDGSSIVTRVVGTTRVSQRRVMSADAWKRIEADAPAGVAVVECGGGGNSVVLLPPSSVDAVANDLGKVLLRPAPVVGVPPERALVLMVRSSLAAAMPVDVLAAHCVDGGFVVLVGGERVEGVVDANRLQRELAATVKVSVVWLHHLDPSVRGKLAERRQARAVEGTKKGKRVSWKA